MFVLNDDDTDWFSGVIKPLAGTIRSEIELFGGKPSFALPLLIGKQHKDATEGMKKERVTLPPLLPPWGKGYFDTVYIDDQFRVDRERRGYVSVFMRDEY